MSERAWPRLVVLLAASSVLLLAACGGGGSSTAAAAPAASPNDTTASGASPNVPAEMQAYVACLKDHGVTLPTGGRFGPGGNGGNGQGEVGQAPPDSFQLGAPQTQVQAQSGGSSSGDGSTG
ncbi:MAG TPA: hypothetical protein VK461_01875, partial [Acidimicrobiales bacterium]|nr:hypothetical protein [Acidimicrobiales bacterium]